MKDTITAAAGDRTAALTDFTREIVAIPSVTGDEEAVVRRIEAEMETLGYDEVTVDPMGNVLGRLGSGPRVLAIDGHCDTVDVGDPDLWERDPFSAELVDGVIYGRGAADQKGGLAAAMHAGALAREIGLPEDLSLYVVASVVEEDVEGLNWQYIVNSGGLRPGAELMTEPTGLGLTRGQRGRMEMRVRTRGVSCHGSAPERGVNAIYRMAPIIAEVEGLHDSLTGEPPLGKGSVTVTDVRSTAPSLCAVADSATIHLDRRLTSGETLESSLAEVRGLPGVQAAGAEVYVPEYEIETWTGLTVPAEAYYPAWLLAEDHPLVQKGIAAFTGQFGSEPEVGVWTFSTNGVATMGLFDIPTIGFGPGHEEHAHMPTDQLVVSELGAALEFYTAFIVTY